MCSEVYIDSIACRTMCVGMVSWYWLGMASVRGRLLRVHACIYSRSPEGGLTRGAEEGGCS